MKIYFKDLKEEAQEIIRQEIVEDLKIQKREELTDQWHFDENLNQKLDDYLDEEMDKYLETINDEVTDYINRNDYGINYLM